ncbi:MAG: hypothetical protein JWM60_1649 [Solirubrobacterales bacterium]|nr:hypothetical protein [Solirubrobacterales bacterium]
MKLLAREYYLLTGRPLGVTGEMAEYEAARILGLKLAVVRQNGYDAIRKTPDGDQLLEIKGRCVPGGRGSQRVGAINLEGAWEAVLLVLLDEEFNATEIYEADREAIIEALQRPGSKARNDRGQLGVSQFKAAGRRIWPMGHDQRALASSG